jgi:hypothetical protein
MSKRSDLVKSIVKGDISESPALDRFLKSRGLNPETVTKDQKVAHSKLGQFKKWQRDHATDLTKMKEEVDKKDMVCLDIPLLIRVLEFTREEMKTDIELHNMVERLINMRHDVPLDMSHYDEITQKLVKENHIAIAMGKMLDDEGSMVLNQIEELERGCAMIRSYIGKDYEKQLPAWVQSKVTLATDYMSTVGNYLSSKNEDVKESYNGPRGDKLIAVSHAAYDAGDKAKSKRAHTLAMKAGERYRSNPENRDKAISHVMSGANKDYTSGKRYTGDSVEHSDENVISEKNIDANSSLLSKVSSFIHNKPKPKPKTSLSTMRDAFKSDAKSTTKQPSSGGNIGYRLVRAEEVVTEGSAALRLAQALRKEREARELKDKSREAAERNEKAREAQQPVKENTLDAKAATEAPCDCANSPDDVAPKDKNKKLIQMSKSARIIKSIYKKKNMKEETYDWEKEGKSVATYGKKPKLSDNEKKVDAVGGKTQAAAVMSGGTTLTGTPRDTVEIDPMMKPPKPGSLGQSDKPKNNNR